MSDWTHSMCALCWNDWHADNLAYQYNPDPAVHHGPDDLCCLCGKAHNSGLYLRVDPRVLPCKEREVSTHTEEKV